MARYGSYLVWLAHEFHLAPPEVRKLQLWEFDLFADAIDELRKQRASND